MSTITFDTHRTILRLKESGLSEPQASAVVDVIIEANTTADLVTKKDVALAVADLKNDLANIKAEITVTKWMLGIVVGGVVTLIMKTFIAG